MWNVNFGTVRPYPYSGLYPDAIACAIAKVADKCDNPTALLCGRNELEHLKVTTRWRDTPIEQVGECKLVGIFNCIYDVYIYDQWEQHGFRNQILVSHSRQISDGQGTVTIQYGIEGWDERGL